MRGRRITKLSSKAKCSLFSKHIVTRLIWYFHFFRFHAKKISFSLHFWQIPPSPVPTPLKLISFQHDVSFTAQQRFWSWISTRKIIIFYTFVALPSNVHSVYWRKKRDQLRVNHHIIYLCWYSLIDMAPTCIRRNTCVLLKGY